MRFTIETKGHGDILDITDQVTAAVEQDGVINGLAVIFLPGATAAITTLEYENGLINDLSKVLETLAPENADYEHHQRWGDHNGAAHIKAALIGPSLTVPVEQGRIQLGSWQQIVLIDFDERPRQREIIVSIFAS